MCIELDSSLEILKNLALQPDDYGNRISSGLGSLAALLSDRIHLQLSTKFNLSTISLYFVFIES